MLRQARIPLVALLLAALLFAGCSPLDKRAAIAPNASAALAPRSSSYDVGAYYFSGWSHCPNDNVSELLTKHYPQSEPLIGWYDDSQEAVDKSIDQAANGGIDFFAFD